MPPNRIAEMLVICAMPFLYGAATRLPFIYFVIHLDDHFKLDWLTIGIYVACYQGSRVVTSGVAIFAPKVSHLLGTCAGLAGYITVLVCDKDVVAPFVIGTAIVGFSETMSSMQKYAKEMYKLDPNREKAQLMLKFQYAFVMVGVVFAFSIGGFVYQYKKIAGVALFGIIIESLALLVLLVFWGITSGSSKAAAGRECAEGEGEEMKVAPFPIKNPDNSKGDEDEESHLMSSFKDKQQQIESCSSSSPSTLKKVKFNGRNVTSKKDEDAQDKMKISFIVDGASNDKSKDEEDQDAQDSTRNSAKQPMTLRAYIIDNLKLSTLLETANANYSTCDLPATWVNWLLCASFGIEALTIGYNLSIGPIFLLNEFNKGTGIIGILFAVGAASGTVAAIGVTCTKFGNNLMRTIAASPFDLCFAMVGIAVGVFVAAVPNFVMHVIGLILLMCFNDLGATMMTELQASITTVSNYSLLGPLGQVVRRCLNVATALTGPVLFGIYPRLPYFVAGGITLLWTIMLSIAFKLRMEKTVEKIAIIIGRSRESVKRSISFATTEVIHSMATNKTTANVKGSTKNTSPARKETKYDSAEEDN